MERNTMADTPGRKRSGLSARFVDTAKTPGKYHDGGGLGLFLHVRKGGSRQFVQRLMVQGRRVEIGLGSPPVVSLSEARDMALDNKRAAYRGLDPLAAKQAKRLTFEEAARKAHEELAPTFKNPKDAAAFLATLQTYIFPKLGRTPLAEVTSAEIRRVVLPVRERTPEVARKLVLRMSAVFKWGIAEHNCTDNPATAQALALPRLTKEKQHRKALPYAEVAACLETVRASGAWRATKLALEFTVLTACRSGEVRAMRWDEIDLGASDKTDITDDTLATLATTATWGVPASRMKMKRPHRVPLSRRALEVLREAKAMSDGSGLVFPSPRGKPLSDMTLSKLVKELGFDADVHGFRTSFRTWAQEQTNFPREVAEAALAHAVGDAVERAYARSDLFAKRRKMMQAWADYLAVKRGELVALTVAK
jgi:integrase